MSERRAPPTPEWIVETAADPRVTAGFLECVPDGTSGATVVLVGVVHDHPASVARVERVIDLLQPATVAVELPPLATPLFAGEPAATSDRTRFGAEMRAAYERARAVGARTAAIDGFDGDFWRRLGGAVRRDRQSAATIGRLLAEVADVTTHALACYLSARLPVDLIGEAEPGIAYDCTALDAAARQAAHERRHASRSRSLLRAIERPVTDQLLDETRERAMAARLATLRAAGPVVAVVGLEHVAEIAATLGKRDD